jgi:Na+/H+ antiporter NhaD/arsenite permease-like protein
MSFPKDLGIRTKIILSIVVLLVFVALLFFWASYMHEKKGLLANMQDSAIALNRALTISITNQKNIAEKVNLQTLVEELSLTEGLFGKPADTCGRAFSDRRALRCLGNR